MDVNNSFDIFSFMSDFYVLFVGIIATKVECVGQFAPLLCIGCDISIFLGSFLDFGVRLFAIKKRIVAISEWITKRKYRCQYKNWNQQRDDFR
ncbi:hypothetical protein AAX21_00435 [Oenococcus oeni]|nr:hypothetical protein AAX21_00435 [Oenococcus oeni]